MAERTEKMSEEEIAEAEGMASDSGRIPTGSTRSNERVDEYLDAEELNEAPHESTGVAEESKD